MGDGRRGEIFGANPSLGRYEVAVGAAGFPIRRELVKQTGVGTALLAGAFSDTMIRGGSKMKRLILIVLAVLLYVLGFQPAVNAQLVGARVEGVVLDATQAVVPGATVTITNVETGISRSASTDAQGRYVFNNLPPARYDLSGSLLGFKTTLRSGITLTIGAEVVVNLTLSLGEVSEQITVSGEAPLIETRSGAVSGVVEEKAIRDLPLNGRSFTNLMQLEPGVVITRAGGKASQSGFSDKMSMGGARPFQMSFLLDGADMTGKDNTNPAGASGILMGVDTIQEFRVSTSASSAEYGRNSGGVISAITKSGTNNFHGTVFEFLRNDKLDARNFFDRTKPAFKRNQFGFVFGGPVIENKTFFFGSYEGLRERLGTTSAASVPTAQARLGTLPNKTVVVAESVKPYLALYPLPNGPDLGGGVGRFFWADSKNTSQNDFLVRLDHQLSDKDFLMGRMFFDDSGTRDPGSLGLFSNVTDSRIQSYVADYKRIFGAAAVNDFRVTFNRYNMALGDEFPESMNALEFVPGRGWGLLSPGGLSAISAGANTPRFWTQNTFEYIDDAVATRGRHTLKFGGILKRIQYNGFSANRFRGHYEFASLENFLTAQVSRYWMANVFAGSRGLRQWLFGLYFQDDWRATSRLVLNLGVRYEAVSSPNEVAGRISNLRYQLDPQVTVGNPYFLNPSLKNFAPRFGFAYDATGDGKTSIRGGYGIYYDQLLPIYYRDNFMRVLPHHHVVSVRPADVPNIPFPNAYTLFPATQVLSDPTVALDLGNYDPDQPYTMQYNLTVQRQLLANLSLLVGYLGSQSRHNTRSANWNSALPTAIIGGEKFFATGSKRRNPNFSSVLQRVTDTNPNYNSLQVVVKKRYSHGLDLNFVYQWSRTMDEGSGIAGSTDFTNVTSITMDPDDRKRDYGRAAFDIRHYLTLNSTYEIPSGALGGAARRVLGGWRLSGLFNYSSGEPFTAVNGVDLSGAIVQIYGAQERPDVAPGKSNNPFIGDPNKWFDPTGFDVEGMAAVGAKMGRFGNLGRNTLQGPNVFVVDLAVLKDFSLREAMKVEFRWEMFNLLNRANFGTPAFVVFLNRTTRNPNAGKVTATRTSSRQMQLALKFIF